jgi:hypothetical protein
MSPSVASVSSCVAILAVIVIGLLGESKATPLDPYKRARASSLIPFPRVGRSVDSTGGAEPRLYFGQKRTGKSSLIPFPRVGRRGGAKAWDLPQGVNPGDLDRFLDRLHHGQEIESDVSDMEATVRNLQRRIDELEATVESHYQRSY